MAVLPRFLHEEYKGNSSMALNATLALVQSFYGYIVIDTPLVLGKHTADVLRASEELVVIFEANKFCYNAVPRFLKPLIISRNILMNV